MEPKILNTSELRKDVAKILKGLREGNCYILMHYNDIVGLITPEIPTEISEKLRHDKDVSKIYQRFLKS